MKNLILIVVSILLFSCNERHQRKETSKIDHTAINNTLTKNLQLAYKKDAIVGFSVTVVNEKGSLYHKGFGFRDIEQKMPYSSNTIQNIASISKTLIGIALLKAQELGKLNIDEPINDYLPFKIVNPNYPEQPTLIKHLAYHTSSITDLDEVYSKSYVLKKSKHNDNEGVYNWFSMPEDKISQVEFMRHSLTEDGKWYTKEIFLDNAPGKIREYSNIGAGLCAYIIELATGQSYESFTKEQILKPLKMKASGWSSKDTDTTNRSRLFAHKKMMIAEYSLITKADGGFIASSNDLGLFLTELIKGYKGEGTLLNETSYQKLFEKHQFPNEDNQKAFGIFIEFSNELFRISDTIIGHDGSDPGVTTAMYFNPKTEIGRIFLANTDSDFDDNYWPEIQEIWKSLIEYELELYHKKDNKQPGL